MPFANFDGKYRRAMAIACRKHGYQGLRSLISDEGIIHPTKLALIPPEVLADGAEK